MDEKALRVELEKHHREGFLWTLNCCSQNPIAAEDVLQKVYVKILAGRARFRGSASFKTWLFALIRNTAADHWREENRHQAKLTKYEQSAEISPPIERPDELLERGQIHAALAKALSALAERQQQVARLVFYHDLSLSEAAEVMGISIGSARTHYERGKDQLRKFLEATKVFDATEFRRE
jgi:RNA polymerase sigma-70 factor, ECF subfamily